MPEVPETKAVYPPNSAVSIGNGTSNNNAKPTLSSAAAASNLVVPLASSAAAKPAVAVQTPPTLRMINPFTKGGPSGEFKYDIDWELSEVLTYNAIIVQSISVDYEVDYDHPRFDDLQEMDNISDLTKDRSCTWQDYKSYWEVWLIAAGHKRPTYDKQTSKPNWTGDLEHAGGKYHDDCYSNDRIQHKNLGTVTTKGWVRYTGSAQLYNASKLDKLDKHWFKKFQDDDESPAGVLPSTTRDPGLSRFASATVGLPVRHDMVAYWNSFANYTMPTVVEPRWYKKEVLRTKVDALEKAQPVSSAAAVAAPSTHSACSSQAQQKVGLLWRVESSSEDRVRLRKISTSSSTPSVAAAVKNAGFKRKRG